MPALDATPIRPRYFAPRHEPPAEFALSVSPRSRSTSGRSRASPSRGPSCAPSAGPPSPARPARPARRARRPGWCCCPTARLSPVADLCPAPIDLARGAALVLVFDPRGRGVVISAVPLDRSTLPTTPSLRAPRRGSNYVEIPLTGHSTLASRVYDVRLRGVVPGALRGRGRLGWPPLRLGIAVLWGYLAVLRWMSASAPTHLTGLLPPWEELVETRLYDSEAISGRDGRLPCVLQHVDLPDLRQCFAGRELVLELTGCPSPPSRSSCPSPATDGGRRRLRGEASPQWQDYPSRQQAGSSPARAVPGPHPQSLETAPDFSGSQTAGSPRARDHHPRPVHLLFNERRTPPSIAGPGIRRCAAPRAAPRSRSDASDVAVRLVAVDPAPTMVMPARSGRG